MYNGIGLTTVRGSATSGHVSKNLSYIRPDFFRNKLDSNQSGGRHGDRNNGGAHFKVNKEVLEHNRKHALEAQVFEYEDSLREKGGFTEDEIESKVADFRANQTQKQVANTLRNTSGSSRSGRATDTHEISARKIEENERLRSAFGIGKDFVSGASFDPVAQEQRRKERELQKAARFEQNKLDRERREAEQVERRKIRDERRGNESVERRGEKRGRDDSRERHRDSRDSRDRERRSRGQGRSDSRERSRSRGRREDDRRRNDGIRDRSRSPATKPVVEVTKSGKDNVAEDGEISSPARPENDEQRGQSPSPRGRRNRSASPDRRSRRSRSPVTRRANNRRSRSQSSYSTSSSSSSSSSSSTSSSSGSDRSRSSSSRSSHRRSDQVKRGRSSKSEIRSRSRSGSR